MVSCVSMHDDPTPPRLHVPAPPLLGVKRIETLARGAILSNGHILLCRDREHGYSYLPGGHVEPGEASLAAVERELAEEAGVVVQAQALAFIAESRFVQRGKPRHELTLVFHVEHSLSADAPVPSLEPHIEFWWAELAALVECDLRPNSAKAWLMTLGSEPTDSGIDWISESLA